MRGEGGVVRKVYFSILVNGLFSASSEWICGARGEYFAENSEERKVPKIRKLVILLVLFPVLSRTQKKANNLVFGFQFWAEVRTYFCLTISQLFLFKTPISRSRTITSSCQQAMFLG